MKELTTGFGEKPLFPFEYRYYTSLYLRSFLWPKVYNFFPLPGANEKLFSTFFRGKEYKGTILQLWCQSLTSHRPLGQPPWEVENISSRTISSPLPANPISSQLTQIKAQGNRTPSQC